MESILLLTLNQCQLREQGDELIKVYILIFQDFK